MAIRCFLIFITLLLTVKSPAQKRCGIHQNDPKAIHHFESWLKAQKRHQSFNRSENTEYIIPVVVHIVHRGEEIGTGRNITDQKVFEQLEILNHDYRRTNADAINTPNIYDEIAADTEISFVLARQDPEGLPTTGILRSFGTQNEYDVDRLEELTADIYWPPEDYLNIYVTDIENFLGYGLNPVANLLGLENQIKSNRIIDGVYVDYQFWGINPNTPGRFESFGRTATHEVGHYLGLRHISGDGGCTFDDFCEDTPATDSQTNGCPAEKSSCGSRDMIENYMDFTNDVCMNLFTLCQKERMLTVLENSPRRKTLLNSLALEEPPVFSVDLGIQSVEIDNMESTCLDEISPRVRIRNYGSDIISGFDVALFQNGNMIESIRSDITLFSLSSTSIIFESIEPNIGAEDEFEIRIMDTDERLENNNSIFEVFRPVTTSIPYEEDFSTFPTSTWTLGPNSIWEINNAPFETNMNNGFVLPYYHSDVDQFGNLDYLISPIFSLDDPNQTFLSFRYAYAQNESEFQDALIIGISTDCGKTFPFSNYVFFRVGSQLESSPTLNQEFVPISSKDWRSVNIDLSEFEGSEIRIAFIGQNGNGNNVFIDDVSIGSNSTLSLDASFGEIDGFSIASCQGIFNPRIEVINRGTQTINEFSIDILTNGSFLTNLVNEDISIRPGRSDFFTIPLDIIDETLENVAFEVVSINGENDQNILNNSFSSNVLINLNEAILPQRENFDNQRTFSEVSTTGTADWVELEINENRVLYSANFNQTELAKENWLVSPNYFLEDIEALSLTFDVSYAQRGNLSDGLRVLLSDNCGFSWSEVIYNKRGSALSTVSQNINEEWFPSENRDWNTVTLDLTEFISKSISDQLRIAFVTTNGNGNNIFLDNIQTFTTSEPNLNQGQSLIVFPNPVRNGTVNISLNLPISEPVILTLVDLSGKIIREELITNALNQRFTYSTFGLGGLYLLNIKGEKTDLTERIFIDQ